MMPLPEHSAHIWLVDQRQVTDDLLQIYREVLSANELQRLEQINHPAVKRAQLISRAAIRYCLSYYANDIAPHQWQFARSEKGKPHLKLPAPLPLSFNLSHSGHWLAIAVTSQADIGVDIQEYRETPSTLKMAQRYFHPAEAEQLQACPGETGLKLFYRLWTLKEAFLKARGTGIGTGLEKIHFQLAQDGTPQADIATELNEHRQNWNFFHTQLEEGYALALAVRGQSLQSKPSFYMTLPGVKGTKSPVAIDLPR